MLLLALISDDGTASQRDIAELEGLVRSAGAVPVGLIQQKRQGAAAHALWGKENCARRHWRPGAWEPLWW